MLLCHFVDHCCYAILLWTNYTIYISKYIRFSTKKVVTHIFLMKMLCVCKAEPRGWKTGLTGALHTQRLTLIQQTLNHQPMVIDDIEYITNWFKAILWVPSFLLRLNSVTQTFQPGEADVKKQSADKSVVYKDPCCHCKCGPRRCCRKLLQKPPLQGELTGKLLQLDTNDSWKSL